MAQRLQVISIFFPFRDLEWIRGHLCSIMHLPLLGEPSWGVVQKAQGDTPDSKKYMFSQIGSPPQQPAANVSLKKLQYPREELQPHA